MRFSKAHIRMDTDKYGGLWVALDKKESVIASSRQAKSAYQAAINKGIKVPILFKVPLEPALVM